MTKDITELQNLKCKCKNKKFFIIKNNNKTQAICTQCLKIFEVN